ncbi:putative O-methylsterigmatocystin oxidoreductase [Colletotrichum phormii]|uniref:O-methylsterigmatocystin oxidoreductase n=1 Tax=Colletotrichum phormii TaxID=359342 RepID=A0AAI9ZE53_9PEZI|nr:putative O-methylsterigmatocystin oxidoreductase [Colletotrichum phormii]KAK1622597.1 putative O-methylsterigmatocystin oxidoreductase [Colletotrichum phormii]
MISVHSTRLAAILLLLAGAVTIHALRTRRTRPRNPGTQRGLPLPPGPRGEPILGHLRIIPTDNPEYAYAAWSKEYRSDVLYFNVLGQPVVVLNSVRAAVDLLDKRGANYCDRPRFVLFEEMGWRKTLTFLRWGSEFRMHRRILQRSFSKTSIQMYRELQEREALVLLKGIIRDPGSWETSLRRFATAVVMSIGFGVNVESDTDPYIQMATDASYALGHGGAPAGTLVDFFPFVRYLPDWLVRDRSLRFARDWSWAIRQIHDAPYAAVTAKKTQDQEHSLIKILLEQRAEQIKSGMTPELSVDDIKGAAGAVYAAGQDTTWSTLVVFVLNMVLHPEVQDKAQRMLDEVVEDGRLPTFEDRPRLPYIDYIVQETLRWCPVSPIGVPHRSLEDDVYDGMFIPKGSFVYANARAMTHDERTYADAGTFDPDRYIPIVEGGRGEPFPVGQFGFGRRVCVGRHLAEASVWIAIASMLATVRIERARGPRGEEIIPLVELTNGLTSHPKRFLCRISPRSSRRAEIVISATR